MAKVYSNDLIGKKESVVDEFLLLNEYQTPLLSILGFGSAVTNVEHTWFEDEMIPFEAGLSAAIDAAVGTLSVDDVEPFRVGHVIKVGEELMRVDAINGSELTVSRGYASTEVAPADAGVKVEVLFTEGEEGRDAREARYKARKRVSNLTQIFDDTVELSGTAMAVNQFGVDSEYEKEKQKKQLELALQLEKSLINGVKFENGTKRMQKGIRSFIQTNVQNAAGSDINDTMLNASFQSIFEKGGFETGTNYKILVPAKQKTAISAFGKADIRLDRLDNGRGQVVDHFVSDFGQAEIVLNNNLASDEIMIVDANRASIRPLQGREFGHTYMGLQGDYKRGMLVGEYTLEFLQEKAHARIKGLK
jgi:hypothetical protein